MTVEITHLHWHVASASGWLRTVLGLVLCVRSVMVSMGLGAAVSFSSLVSVLQTEGSLLSFLLADCCTSASSVGPLEWIFHFITPFNSQSPFGYFYGQIVYLCHCLCMLIL